MKNKLLYLLLLSAWITGYAQVQIGSDTKNPSFLFPFRVGANYSYAQTIYLASEINASGAITSIKWYYTGTSDLPNSQSLDIYLKTTTKSSFATDTDWVPVTADDKYYSAKGINTGSAPGWVTITLDKPFQYNGTDNLVVGVDENKDNSDTNNTTFYTTEVSEKRSIICYNVSTSNPDPLNPPTSGYTKNSGNFVPNIIFVGLTQSCITPANISFSNITASGATVSWNDSETHTEGSQYYLSTLKTPPTASIQATGSASTIKSINITGLSPITTYYVWVRNNCGSGSYSAWSEMTSFFSGCGTFPTFFENFDSATSGNLPYCWTKIIRGDGNVTSAIVRTVASSAYSSPNILQLSNATATGTYDIIAVSPELPTLPLGTNRLKFYAKYAGTGITSGTIQIGTLNGNTNAAVFTPLVGQTINVSNAYALYTVDLTGYTGTDRYIGIRHASTTANTQIYIDNVLYELKPGCPDLSNIAIAAVTDKKVTVSWKDGQEENNWDIAIGDATVTDPSTLAFETTSNTAHTFTTAKNLTPGTTYKVWVRSNCAADKKGYYFGGLAFTTFCTSATLVNENFDATTIGALPACWSKILRGTALSANAYIQTIGNTGSDANFATSAPNSARLFSDVASGVTDVILVSPPLSNLGANTHRLRFKVSGKVTPQLQIGTLDTNIATAIFTPLNVTSQPLISVASYPSVEYIVDFSSYAGGTDMFIGFKLISAGGAKTIYIDDVVWEPKPPCADVKNIVVSGVTTNSAGFTWGIQGTEHLWDVAVGPNAAQDPTGLNIVTTDPDVNAAEVSNLQPGTAYKAWVRSHCDLGNGNWIGPVPFNTECNAAPSFSENFEAYPYVVSQKLPPCWKKIIRNASADSFIGIEVQNVMTNGVKTGEIHKITAYAGSSNSLADVILVCPMVSTLNDSSYRLNINVQGSNNIEVGTVNNVSPTAIFTKITEFAPKGLQTVDLSSYTGTDQYIALRLKTVNPGSSQYITIDDINWTVTALGTNEFDLPKMNYYPNPVNDFLNISCDSTITSVSIYNVLGQLVLEDTVSGSNINVNMSMLNAGAYFVKLAAGNQTKTIKITKE